MEIAKSEKTSATRLISEVDRHIPPPIFPRQSAYLYSVIFDLEGRAANDGTHWRQSGKGEDRLRAGSAFLAAHGEGFTRKIEGRFSGTATIECPLLG